MGSGVNQQWPQHQGHYNHQVSAELESGPWRGHPPSAVTLYAGLTYWEDGACLFVQHNITAEKKQIKDYFRKLLANIEVGQPPQLNHETANQISHFASMYHGSAAAEIASVIVEFIRDVSYFIPCFVGSSLLDTETSPFPSY